MVRALLVVAVHVVLLVTGASGAAAHEEGPSPYRWVRPLAGNTQSGPGVAVSRQLLGHPSPVGSAASVDGQIQVSLEAGAMPTPPGEEAVVVRLIPLDPAGLPRVPGRSVAEGNAYRVDVTYAGSGAALSRLSVPAVLTLVAPSRASAMLRLQGTSWVPVPTVQLDEESRSGLVGRSEQLGTFVLVHRQSDAPISPDEAARASAETNQVPTTAPTVRTAAAATRARPADDPPGDEPVRPLLVLTGVVALTLLARLLRRRDG